MMTSFVTSAPRARVSNFFSSWSDPALVDAGAHGELLVARVRMWTIAAIALVPFGTMFADPGKKENYVGLAAMLLAAVASFVILQLARRGDRISWLPLVTSLFDVSLISATQLGYLLQGLPSVAVNSRTAFMAYFLAIGWTCLRWDVRICITAGSLAIVQYFGVALGAWSHWPTVVTPDILTHGTFAWANQFGRLIFLGAFTWLCIAIIQQSLRLRISSTHDALTGLSNRAYFDERLQEELVRAARHGRPLTVALVDIDHFKEVNDRLGHDAGDHALKGIAKLFKGTMRSSDLVARWGGEEFAIVMTETSRQDAFRKIDWLRATVAAHPLSLPNGETLTLTVSAGLASYPDDGSDSRELFVAADVNLLDAKRNGRDRVVMRVDAAQATRPLGVPL
jgi:diguanylate cyclase (GGDEF)-like protein